MDRQAIQQRFGIIGDSPALRRVIDRVRQVARADLAVLIEGESGVGKELFASLLHELSPRRHEAFVVVNCGAIPEGLIEAELFGAEKGAYTGSVERRVGYFEEADGGTIFLDEIGELPLQAQVRLLRVLEDGTFSRVGSSGLQRVDVRLVAATNKDLAVEVREGRFREDLYYRLSTVLIRVPPLRERPEDVLALFEHFLHRSAQRFEAPMRRLDEGARELLVRYNWPGNVRELRNVAEQTAVLVRGDTATADDLRPFLRGVSAALGLARASGTPGMGDAVSPSDDPRERELIYRALLELRLELRELRGLVAGGRGGPAYPAAFAEVEDEVAPYAFIPDDDGADDGLGGDAYDGDVETMTYQVDEDAPLGGPEPAAVALPSPVAPDSALRLGPGPLPTMEEAEQALIAEALRRFGGNRRQTAQALGISERTLYRKIKDLEAQGIEV